MDKHIQAKITACRASVARSHGQIDYHRRKAAVYEANARYEAERLQDLLRINTADLARLEA